MAPSNKLETCVFENPSNSTSEFFVVSRPSLIFRLFALHSRIVSGAGIGPGFGLDARL